MNKYYNIIIALLLVQLSLAMDLSNTDSIKIATYVKNEVRLIENYRNDLANRLKKPDYSNWVEGDFKYYSAWQSGLAKEVSRDYKSAISIYKNAYRITRNELSTYPVLLSLGRVYYLSKQNKLAKQTLNKYVNEALNEIRESKDAEYGLSEDGKKELLLDIDFAKWLLSKL